MQTEERNVISFISEFLSARNLSLHTRIAEDLGVDGDDAVELLEEYSRRFSVDISSFSFDDYFGPEAAFNPFYFLLNLFTKNPTKLKTLCVRDLVKGAKTKILR